MSTPQFVLFVDDDPDILETVTVMVEEEFPHASTATSIEAAKELLQSKTFSCVVVDIDINGQNGAEIVKFIRDTKPMNNHKSPLVIMSGFVNDDFREKFNSRVDGIISKPFESADLVNIIKMAIKKKVPSRKVQIEVGDQEMELSVFDPKVTGPFKIQNLQSNVSTVLKKMLANKKLKSTLSNIKGSGGHIMMRRIGLIINIASGLSKELGWGSDKTLEKFVFAAYLHDIALGNDPRYAVITVIDDIESGEFTEEEEKLLKYHPQGSVQLLSSLGIIPSDVSTIIEQHHEKANGTGFPVGLDYKRISTLSSVFIVAHDLTNYIIENEKWSIESFSNNYSQYIEGPQFKKVMRALNSIDK
ncbi:MAG: response regulator [Halobacteriovoraceae bacterium]|nr:response regulator [Halobacteriovoraceae bacterium]